MRGADPWARLLFIAMWNWADDTGRGTANVRELAAFAFPDEEDPIAPTAAELPSLLAEVRGRWGVVFYEVGGRRYYAIPSWDDHQRNERRAKSRHPAPEDGTEYDPGPPEQGERRQPRNVAELPTHSGGSSAATDGSSDPGTGEQGNRGRRTTSLSADAQRQPDEDSLFDRFWAEYPRKVDKQDARKAFRSVIRQRKVDPQRLIDAARSYAAQRQGQDPKFTKHAATWLNKGAYDNEPETPALQLVSGDYLPYRNPADQSVYDEPMFPEEGQ